MIYSPNTWLVCLCVKLKFRWTSTLGKNRRIGPGCSLRELSRLRRREQMPRPLSCIPDPWYCYPYLSLDARGKWASVWSLST